MPLLAGRLADWLYLGKLNLGNYACCCSVFIGLLERLPDNPVCLR